MMDARSDSPAVDDAFPCFGAAAPDAAAVGLFGRGGAELASAAGAAIGRSAASHVRTRSAPVARPAARCGGGEDRSSSPPGADLDARKKKLSKSKLMLQLCRERRSSSDLSNGSGSDGLRMMSPADERMIDEAIELANQFARTSLHEQEPDASVSAAKSRSKFLLKFPLKKSSAQQAEKKSFTDGLAMKASAAVAQLLTPESEKAYDELVARVGSPCLPPSNSVPPFARSNSVTGSSNCQAAAGRARTTIDAFATITRPPSIQRRSSSPAMTVTSTTIGRSSSLQQPSRRQQQPQLTEHGRQPAVEQTTCSEHQSSAPRPILRKSLSAMEHSPVWNASHASSAAYRRGLPSTAGGFRDVASEMSRRHDDSDIDEGIMADDLSDLPSSPPPPVPLAPSTAYVGIGLYNNLDPFWRHEMRLDFEADEELTNMQGRYKTRSEDNVSYEELLEFAPVFTHYDQDVVRVMQKVLGREVPESECQRALRETRGDVLNAIKFVKLVQLWRQLQNDGLRRRAGATVAQCKDALMYCNWDVSLAAKHVGVNWTAPADTCDTTAVAAAAAAEWPWSSPGGAAMSSSSSRPAAAAVSRPVSRRTLSCPLAWSGT